MSCVTKYNQTTVLDNVSRFASRLRMHMGNLASYLTVLYKIVRLNYWFESDQTFSIFRLNNINAIKSDIGSTLLPP